MLSIILIRLSCHKFANVLMGKGSRHNFILLRLQTLSYDKKNFLLRRTCSGMSFKSKQKNPIRKMATCDGDSDLYKWHQEWIKPPPDIIGRMPRLGWKLLSCSQCQELGQRAFLAPDWFCVIRQPIRSQIGSLTKPLTLNTTQKFPSLCPRSCDKPPVSLLQAFGFVCLFV